MSVHVVFGAEDTNTPRIMWDKITGVVTSSTEAALYDDDFANQPQTYTAWKPTAVPATWTITPASAVPVDCCCIGVHTLGTAGATITVEYLVGASWTTVTTIVPTDNSAIMVLFEEVTNADAWRIGVTDAIAELGVIMFGQAMVFPRMAQFAPATPITEAEQYAYNINRSDAGNYVGRSLTSRGLKFTVDIANISEDFAAGDWADFRVYANEGDSTFFIAPKPISYPNEIAYVFSPQTLMAPRSVANRAISRSITLECEGYLAL